MERIQTIITTCGWQLIRILVNLSFMMKGDVLSTILKMKYLAMIVSTIMTFRKEERKSPMVLMTMFR